VARNLQWERNLTHPKVSVKKAKRVEIQAARPRLVFQADGELLGEAPARFHCSACCSYHRHLARPSASSRFGHLRISCSSGYFLSGYPESSFCCRRNQHDVCGLLKSDEVTLCHPPLAVYGVITTGIKVAPAVENWRFDRYLFFPFHLNDSSVFKALTTGKEKSKILGWSAQVEWVAFLPCRKK